MEIADSYTVLMNSKLKGTLAVTKCIAKLYEKGFEVFLPLGDRMPYDLIFDDGKYLKKVQVKYSGKNSRGKYVAALRVMGGNQTYCYAKKYNDNDFDYLFVYTADDRHFLIKWNEVECRNEIHVDDKKYQKYKL